MIECNLESFWRQNFEHYLFFRIFWPIIYIKACSDNQNNVEHDCRIVQSLNWKHFYKGFYYLTAFYYCNKQPDTEHNHIIIITYYKKLNCQQTKTTIIKLLRVKTAGFFNLRFHTFLLKIIFLKFLFVLRKFKY